MEYSAQQGQEALEWPQAAEAQLYAAGDQNGSADAFALQQPVKASGF